MMQRYYETGASQVIHEAILDWDKFRYRPAPAKNLLCASFIRATLSPFPVLNANIALLAAYCDWAIVIYDAPSLSHVEKLCDHVISVY